jgi:hypothetical protein
MEIATPSPLDALIPIIVAIVKQSGFPSNWNALLAGAVYVVWTGVSLYTGVHGAGQPLTVDLFISTLVTAATTGFLSYQLFWSQLGGGGGLEQKLEHSTSVYQGPVSEPVIDDQAPTDGNG